MFIYGGTVNTFAERNTQKSHVVRRSNAHTSISNTVRPTRNCSISCRKVLMVQLVTVKSLANNLKNSLKWVQHVGAHGTRRRYL